MATPRDCMRRPTAAGWHAPPIIPAATWYPIARGAAALPIRRGREADGHGRERAAEEDSPADPAGARRLGYELRRGREVGTHRVDGDADQSERGGGDHIRRPPGIAHHARRAYEGRPERGSDGPRSMEAAHESDVAPQRGFGIYGRVEQADTATEH